MKRFWIILPCFAFSFANAYELGTHGQLTNEAYKRSALSDSQFLSNLGINGLDPSNPFGKSYYDMAWNQVMERTATAFEQSEKRMPDGAKPLSISGWLMRGAIREDDAKGESNPQDDPYYPNLKRPLHHFFDPVLNRPLTATGLSSLDSDVHKAPDWAVGSRDAFNIPNAQEYARRNHFTVFDAREAMYRALTGRDGQGNVVAATEAERNKYWATTFRALGDVVHLVQDMGQPQHTRNDPHAGKFFGLIGGHASVYEKYIEARATGANSYRIDGTPASQLPPLNFDGYPIPTFPKYSDYWSIGSGTNGRGLADYSNRGFFSAGTNLGSNIYSSPANNAANYVKEETLYTGGVLAGTPLLSINFLKGGVA